MYVLHSSKNVNEQIYSLSDSDINASTALDIPLLVSRLFCSLPYNRTSTSILLDTIFSLTVVCIILYIKILDRVDSAIKSVLYPPYDNHISEDREMQQVSMEWCLKH